MPLGDEPFCYPSSNQTISADPATFIRKNAQAQKADLKISWQRVVALV
jgi:hypothetical protein